MVTCLASEHHRLSTSTKLHCSVTEAGVPKAVTDSEVGETQTRDLSIACPDVLPLGYWATPVVRIVNKWACRLLWLEGGGAHTSKAEVFKKANAQRAQFSSAWKFITRAFHTTDISHESECDYIVPAYGIICSIARLLNESKNVFFSHPWLRRPHKKTALGWHSNTSRQSDADQLRWQSLQCSWTLSLELSADGPQTAGLAIQPFQRIPLTK